MRTLPMPSLDTDEEVDEFYNSGMITMGYRIYDIIEGLDKVLANYGLEIGMFDAHASDYILTIIEKE